MSHVNDKKAKLKVRLAVDMEAEQQSSAYARTVLARLTDADAVAPSAGSPATAPVVVERSLRPNHTQVRHARAFICESMSDLGVDQDHVRAVDAVIDEFMTRAVELGARDTMRLTIESFHLLTSVRLRCSQALSARDAPFGPRERNLEKLTFAHGTRRNADGTEDMWAEVTRPE
jgi:hypothetical protein